MRTHLTTAADENFTLKREGWTSGSPVHQQEVLLASSCEGKEGQSKCERLLWTSFYFRPCTFCCLWRAFKMSSKQPVGKVSLYLFQLMQNTERDIWSVRESPPPQLSLYEYPGSQSVCPGQVDVCVMRHASSLFPVSQVSPLSDSIRVLSLNVDG